MLSTDLHNLSAMFRRTAAGGQTWAVVPSQAGRLADVLAAAAEDAESLERGGRPAEEVRAPGRGRIGTPPPVLTVVEGDRA